MCGDCRSYDLELYVAAIRGDCSVETGSSSGAALALDQVTPALLYQHVMYTAHVVLLLDCCCVESEENWEPEYEDLCTCMGISTI